MQKRCKGGGRCCKGRTIIHKSAVESTSHKGANNGRSITKGNGDGVV